MNVAGALLTTFFMGVTFGFVFGLLVGGIL